MVFKTFGEYFKHYFEEKGYTLNQVHELTGVSTNTLYKIEQHGRRLIAPTALKLEKIPGVSARELLIEQVDYELNSNK